MLRPGSPGAPDSLGVALYGTVIRIGDELRMWYLCAGDLEKGDGFTWLPNAKWRVGYATSKNGINWEKPDLGLVSYGGNNHNNLVAFKPIAGDFWASVVIHDPDDPNPARRFKMIYESPHSSGCSVAWSKDGLTWTNSPLNPIVKKSFEPSGLIKRNGSFYAVGHGAGFVKRVLVVHASGDFEHWSSAVSLGFRRDNVGPLAPFVSGGQTGEQVHLGASLCDRGNIILGLYGQWHGPSPESNDRRDMTMDIGFLVSHDALHYYEPIPGFKIIPGADEKFAVMGFRACLVQGQGIVSVGDKSLAWYSLWGPGGADGVRVATWSRDRFGYYSVPTVATKGQKGIPADFVTCPIWLTKQETKIYLNADGLGEHSQLTVDVLDDKFREIPDYSGTNSIPMTKSGLREPVTWRNKAGVSK